MTGDTAERHRRRYSTTAGFVEAVRALEDHARAVDAPDEVITQAADHVDGRKVFVGARLLDGETPLARGEALFVGLRPGLA